MYVYIYMCEHSFEISLPFYVFVFFFFTIITIIWCKQIKK